MQLDKPKILAIDDTPSNLLTLGSALSEGFDVQIADSGAMGITIAKATPPDLILLDVMMPEMDGFETLQKLRRVPTLRDIPVVFITSLNDRDSEEKGLSLGAADYITKPINLKIACQRIHNLIERELWRRQLHEQHDLLECKINELHQSQAELLVSNVLKKTILNSLDSEIAVLDPQGIILAVNDPWQTFARDNRAQPDQAVAHVEVGSNYFAVFETAANCEDPQVAQAYQGIRAVMNGTLPYFTTEYPCHSPTEQQWFSMNVLPLNQGAQGVVITHTNITDRVEAQALLKESETRLLTIIYNEPECVKIVDTQGLLQQMNPAGLAMIEADELAQVVGLPVLNLIAPEYRAAFAVMHQRVLAGESVQLEFEVVGLKGGRRWLETHAAPMQDRGRTVQLAVTRDISQRKQMEERVLHLAFHDTLTHLPNRRLLNDRLRQAMAGSKRNACYCALLFLDLDNFKPLNDAHGHGMGDLLLLEVAKRLTTCVREVDTVARFGGDEFLVLLTDLGTDRASASVQARFIAEKLRASLSEPYQLAALDDLNSKIMVTHRCTASIGVAVFFDPDATPDDVIKHADTAMYQAKEGGRNMIRLFDETT